MARRTYGINSSAITWEPTESRISVSDTGEATINVRGSVNSNGIGLEQAMLLIPATLPITSNGPIGNSTRLAGAKLSEHGGEYDDGTWVVTASYKKSLALTANYGDGTQRSDSDRAERRIIVVEEPLLTHPVALAFPTKERNLLSNYIQGNIAANPSYEPEGSEPEFIWTTEVGSNSAGDEVEFSAVDSTVDGIEASPLDYARLIKAGIQTYQRKSVRHSWMTTRDEEATSAQYRSVGSVVTNPPLAPSLAAGYQWMMTGIIDTTDNGKTWNTGVEYEASGAGGFLKALYKGGAAEIDQS